MSRMFDFTCESVICVFVQQPRNLGNDRCIYCEIGAETKFTLNKKEERLNAINLLHNNDSERGKIVF